MFTRNEQRDLRPALSEIPVSWSGDCASVFSSHSAPSGAEGCRGKGEVLEAGWRLAAEPWSWTADECAMLVKLFDLAEPMILHL